MGKVEDQRKMREAKYLMRHGTVAPVVKPKKRDLEEQEQQLLGIDQICGHKNMSGKPCTRQPNHPEKNHRYK